MPRLLPRLLQHLSRIHSPNVPLLLRETRDLNSALNELRWLREHVHDTLLPNPDPHNPPPPLLQHQRNVLLRSLCARRGMWGEPIQYLLGKEYFGLSGVEIAVQRGVLIPRAETVDVVEHFADLWERNQMKGDRMRWERGLEAGKEGKEEPRGLRVVDFCTGTGCIPLLLHSLLYPPSDSLRKDGCLQPKILGIDLSKKAITLAKRNLEENVKGVGSVHSAAIEEGGVGFVQGNVFDLDPELDLEEDTGDGGESESNTVSTVRKRKERGQKLLDQILRFFHDGDEDIMSGIPEVDVVISNPPYIPPREYLTTTSRSVRRWEPKLALVPPALQWPAKAELEDAEEPIAPGDEFYPVIARIADQVFSAKALVVEVGGDEEQVERVRRIVEREWDADAGGTAIWRDWGGRRRAVVAWRREIGVDGGGGWKWLGEQC
ncbi:S-adenosyl-L-methionine-dependent methyltransferase [Kalaharituber pfeilii]|nr:S-adenosyl-L-methionine-dependent methyltransferase [Kalaharituber pfeilii]